MSDITFETDPLGGSVWAFNDEHHALVWFTGTGRIMYVINPFKGTGSWVQIDNPVYSHAQSRTMFETLARTFFDQSLASDGKE